MTTLNTQLKRIWDAMHPAEGIPDHLRRFRGHLEEIRADHTELTKELELILNALVAFTPSRVIIAFNAAELAPVLEQLADKVAALSVTKPGKPEHDQVVQNLRQMAAALAKGQHTKLTAAEGNVLPAVDAAFSHQITAPLTSLVGHLKDGNRPSFQKTAHAQSRLASLEDLVARIKEALNEIKRLESAETAVPADRRVANSLEDIEESLRRLTRDFQNLKRQFAAQTVPEPAPQRDEGRRDTGRGGQRDSQRRS